MGLHDRQHARPGRTTRCSSTTGSISAGNYGLEPNRAAARTFLDLLRRAGSSSTAPPATDRDRPAPASTTLALIESLPLDDVLIEMLHTSDNNTAEMILKEIGFVAIGQGTRQAGLDVVRSTLERWGVPLDGVELHDGSGLEPRQQGHLRCPVCACSHRAGGADDCDACSRSAGRDGTLSEELLGTPAEGELGPSPAR